MSISAPSAAAIQLPAAVYQPSLIKPRQRRTKRQLEELDDAIYRKAEEYQPATLRQIYYGLVSDGVIDKTEEAYHLIGRQLVKLRRRGELPFDWIADNTRWMRKPRTHSDLETMLRETSLAPSIADSYGGIRKPTLKSGWRRMRSLACCLT